MYVCASTEAWQTLSKLAGWFCPSLIYISLALEMALIEVALMEVEALGKMFRFAFESRQYLQQKGSVVASAYQRSFRVTRY